MLDINDLLDYCQDDCVFDIFDCDSTNAFDCTIEKDLSREELEEWLDNHDYELYSFEPIQRKDNNDNTIFGIVFNVGKVEEMN